MKIFAVDIEASGQNTATNFAVQLGMACVDSELYDPENPSQCIVSQFSTFLPQPVGTEWEPRCVIQFWEKNPELYARAKEGVANAPPLAEAVSQLLQWIKTHQDLNAANNLLISDCASFDFVFLAHILKDHSYPSLLYLFGDFENIPIDTQSFEMGLGKRNIALKGTWGTEKPACEALGTTMPDFSLQPKGLDVRPKAVPQKEVTLSVPLKHDAGNDALEIALKFTHLFTTLNKVY
jgi:hypothetical protein